MSRSSEDASSRLPHGGQTAADILDGATAEKMTAGQDSIPPIEQVRAELLNAGVINTADTIQLQPVAGNPNRRDHLLRHRFHAICQKKTVCLVIYGYDLASLWERARGFAQACPEIACRPLFFRNLGENDIIGFAFFEGRDLESLWRKRRIEIGRLREFSQKIVTSLERTAEPSTPEAAAQELESLFAQVFSLPLFNALDQALLQHAIFPLVRAGVLAGPPQTRWTNGDLIPRNVLVNDAGNLRLVDYEFAARTHLFIDDHWRWRVFSSLPESARDLPGLSAASRNELWQEACFLLRQLILAYDINGAQQAAPDSKPALDRLFAIAKTSQPGFHSSAFLERELAAKGASVEQHAQQLSRLTMLLDYREKELAAAKKDVGWQASQQVRSAWQAMFGAKLKGQRYFIDSPNTWRCTASALSIRGWFFAESPQEIVAIQARVNGRIYPGLYGLDRPDVASVHPKHLQAKRSGFQVEVDLRPGDKKVELAVSDNKGRWHVFCRRRLQDGSAETVKGTYAHWIKQFDTFSPDQLETLTRKVLALSNQPCISVILPIYNTPEKLLVRAIESVRAQIYPHWELCIADDASNAPHVRPLLEHYERIDNRIRVVFRAENGHIAAASNSALQLASGSFVAMLDHDDEITSLALAEVVEAINRQPDAQLLYCDEDKIDEDGNRYDPYFKPDWMPDLLVGHNYMCHFCVCRTDTVRLMGGWRTGFDGAQDWDLELRLVERIKPEQIVHIPHILYHWRAVAGSTALATGEKDYVVEAARRALTDHFQRTNERVELLHQPGNHWRIRYALPAPAPLVSLIVPTRNGLKHLRCCIDSILEKTTYPNYEILIVDNDSDEPAALKYLEQIAQPRSGAPTQSRNCTIRVLHYPHPFNFSAISNLGVREAQGEFVGLLNNDLEVITPDWLEELVSQAARPGIGCVGTMLYFPNDTLQHAGVVLGIGGVAGHAFKGFPRGTPGSMNRARLAQNFSAVTGACLFVRKSTYEAVGGLDEVDLAVSLNDVDFCLKVLAAGYRNLWTPFAELYHHESATRGYEDTPEKRARFEKERNVMKQRWGALLARDPAYNPNLTIDTEDFALAYPPREITGLA